MSIQESIDLMLKSLRYDPEDPESREKIDNIKFLKAELQRGKSKVVSDHDATKILVSLLRSQEEMFENGNLTMKSRHDALNFFVNIKLFLSKEILEQIYMEDIQLTYWIERNIDFSKYKNRMQAMKDIKTAFPYVDGNLIKSVLDGMV